MYVMKNALRNLCRSKGRSFLIGIIVFVIAVSACLGLSIHQASETAKKEARENLTITASISIDREAMMQQVRSNAEEGQSFDKDSFKSRFQEMDSLSVEELLTYAKASTVQDFYYSTSVSMNGSDSFEAVDGNESEEEQEDATSTTQTTPQMEGRGGMPGMEQQPEQEQGPDGFRKGTFGQQGDFTLVGYGSDAAMTDFLSGTCTITEGTMFEEGTEDPTCVISEELALYNDLDLTDNKVITITNPNDEEETYELTVVGIYSNSQSTVTASGRMGGFSTSTDPANQIYLSYNALAAILAESEANATVETEESTGRETTTALPEQVSGTYVFATLEDYEAFTQEVYDLGLSESYVVSSSDASSYEESIQPLENLNEMAIYFLCVVLAIGAIILVVLNIFSVRERKYEVGVLTAIGMKKHKVSLQFLTETLLITLTAILLGGVAGGAASVTVTNRLLESQIEAQQSKTSSNNQAFGREMNPDGMGGGPSAPNDSDAQTKPSDSETKAAKPSGFGGMMNEFAGRATNYVSQVDSAANLTVMLQLLGIGLILTLIASGASIVFIMRYEPLKILSNRD